MGLDQRNYSRSKNLPTKRGRDDPGLEAIEVRIWFLQPDGRMIDRQSGDQVGYVGPLHGQAWMPHFNLVQTEKVHEHVIQQDVQISKTVDHAFKNQLQYPLPSKTSTRLSLPSFSCAQ